MYKYIDKLYMKEGSKLSEIKPGIKPGIETVLSNLNILSEAKNTSRVKEPYWTNNVTRLNESNMNNLRDNLITYLDQSISRTYNHLTEDITTEIIDRNAGWRSFEVDGFTRDYLGEIFNDYSNNTAESKYSSVFGENNHIGINQDGQFVIGRYANTEEEANGVYALFVIGNGTSNENRHNAIIVKTDGSVEINGNTKITGKLTVTGRPTAKQHVVRKQELDELRSEISGALHYRGITPSIPTSADIIILEIDETDVESNVKENEITAVAGDVVLVGSVDENNNITTEGNEYIFDGSTWADYSTSANYVLKKVYAKDLEDINNKITTEAENSLNRDKYITGLTNFSTSDKYPNRNEQLRLDLTKESDDRENADKAINRAAFGEYDAPTTGDSLQKQITDEANSRKFIDEKIYGDAIPQNNNLTLISINNALSKNTVDLQQSINNINSVDFIEIDGGGAADADPESFK